MQQEQPNESTRLISRDVGAEEKEPDRPLTTQELLNLDNLASSKYRAAKYTEAEQLLRKAYTIRKEQLGEDNEDTLMTLNNLAAALGRQSKFDEAEEAFQKTLNLRAAKFGRDHCDTLLTINHLGVLFKQQGKLSEAEPLLAEALTGFVKTFGVKHLCTAEASYNYAVLCVQLGKRKQSAKHFENSYLGLKDTLGEEHPHTLDALQWKMKCADLLTPSSPSPSARSLSTDPSTPSPPEGTSPTSEPYVSQKDWVVKKSCELCQTTYTMFRREHHCRICSKSICNDCSPGRTMVLEFDPAQPVRICTQCEQQGF